MFGVLGRQAGGRFVEQEHVGDAGHVEARVETLALATTQRFVLGGASSAVAALAQPELVEAQVGALFSLRVSQVRAADRRGEIDVLLHREERVEGVLVGDVGNVGPDVVEVLVERVTVDVDDPGVRALVAGEGAQQRALAAAARADDADHLAALRGERDMIERVLAAIVAKTEVGDLEVADQVALLLDDAVAEMAGEELPGADRDGVAIGEGHRRAHEVPADRDRFGRVDDFQLAALLLEVALDAEEDVTGGPGRQQDIALLEEVGVVRHQVIPFRRLQFEAPAQVARAAAQVRQQDLGLVAEADLVVQRGGDGRASGNRFAVQGAVSFAQC